MKTKMLVTFVVINGKRERRPAEVIEVTAKYAQRKNVFVTASGDIFKCRKAKLHEYQRYGCNVVAVK